MNQPQSPEPQVFIDTDALTRAAAERLVSLCVSAVAQRGAFHLALAGGSTPRSLYQYLASPDVQARVPWSDVHIYFGDERSVDHDHPDSNYRMARETLLAHVPIPEEQVHPMNARADHIEYDADQYASLLKQKLPLSGETVPVFDLILLGMGDDGHTASLFPETPILAEYDKPVAAVFVPRMETWRISLTFPVLNAAHHILFLISGKTKAPVITRIFSDSEAATPLPVQQIAAQGTLEWYLDQAAASGLKGA